MKTKHNIGEALHFDEYNCSRAITQLKELLPFVTDLVRSYDSLLSENITQAEVIYIIQYGVGNAQGKYTVKVNADHANLNLTTGIFTGIITDAIDKAMSMLESKRKPINNTISNIRIRSMQEPIELEDILVSNGKVSIDEAKVKERYTLRITTKEQCEFLELLEAAKQSVDKVADALNEHGYDHAIWPMFEPGYVFEIFQNRLEILPHAINYIKPQKQAKQTAA